MSKSTAPRAPSGLGVAGRALWRSVSSALPDGFAWDERELAILTMAAHQADDLAALEAAIEQHGAMVVGSKGQPVLNPAIGEARQARLTVSRLLGLLGIPDEDEEPKTAASRHGQKAAQARWSRKENMQRRKAEVLAKRETP